MTGGFKTALKAFNAIHEQAMTDDRGQILNDYFLHRLENSTFCPEIDSNVYFFRPTVGSEKKV